MKRSRSPSSRQNPRRAATKQTPVFVRDFPLPRPYTGLMLGNGLLGLMVWGDDTLRISVGRAGFWDHRDGVPFTTVFDFLELRRILENEGEAGIKKRLGTSAKKAYRRPCMLPGGRVDVRFGRARPLSGVIGADGQLVISLDNGGRAVLFVDAENEVAFLTAEGARIEAVSVVPAWEYIGHALAQDGARPPDRLAGEKEAGFVQTLPDDPALAVVARWSSREVTIATALGTAPLEEARRRAGVKRLVSSTATAKWWRRFRDGIPILELPDGDIRELWEYGIHKLAGMTPAHAPPATLQGAWMAENEFPPWSNDYHFNINLQMIYGPCLAANRLEHFGPLWRMILEWMPRLRDNGARFFNNPEALLLPHAVDDRCQVIGHYWQGTVDQACVAWIARMAWLHYRYSMDVSVLREVAWPLLRGAFEGFWALSEEIEEGGRKRLSLPVSVSPEYRPSGGRPAWGRDASFQLAAFHMLAETLPQAAAILREPEDPRWRIVRELLPRYATMPLARKWPTGEAEPRIVLWAGQDLEESHRHHSHLAGLYPFETLDPFRDPDRVPVRHALLHWTALGQGQWVGWSFPWAAQIFARIGEGDAALHMLRTLRLLFTNEGGQTLHNANSIGVTSWIHGPFLEPPGEGPRTYDQMQMDAAMGALSAIMDILVHSRRGVIHILPACPRDWRDFEFDGIRAEGAFLIGATVESGRLAEIRVRSLAGAPIRLRHGWQGPWRVNGRDGEGPEWNSGTERGGFYRLRPR